ncbi:hypothetical protein ACA910_016430 [Epithemia clementina (nom. ined.)]
MTRLPHCLPGTRSLSSMLALLLSGSLQFRLLGLYKLEVVRAVQTSKFQILIPQSLSKPGKGYDHRDALFGIPPYGGSIQQQVFYADTDLCDANNINAKGGYPQRSDGSAWQTPFILLVDRGGCSFVVKVRNAQRAGAAGVLIADDLCLCDRPDCKPETDEVCETREPLMADDGSGADVSIPSFLLFREDADQIKQALMNNQHVRAQMSFKVPAPGARVEYQLWTAPSDFVSRSLEQTFGLAAAALGDRASFQPHPYIYDGISAGCQTETGEDECFNLCLNDGRYCTIDPDDDMQSGSSGADVVREALRRLCIWQTYGTDGIGQKWWDYVTAFIDGCQAEGAEEVEGEPVQLNFNDPECVSFAMVVAQVDENVINDCMEKSGELGETSNVTNTLLEQEIKDQKAAGVVLIPSLVVNGAIVHGSLSFSTVLKAVCSGFSPGSEPAVCLKCADCNNELDCVEFGSCRSGPTGLIDSVVSGDVPLEIFVGVLFGFAALFGCVLCIQSRRQQRMMRDQVRGIVADYMPVSSQNTRTGDTSLALAQDEDDGDDHGNNGYDNGGATTNSSFSIT